MVYSLNVEHCKLRSQHEQSLKDYEGLKILLDNTLLSMETIPHQIQNTSERLSVLEIVSIFNQACSKITNCVSFLKNKNSEQEKSLFTSTNDLNTCKLELETIKSSSQQYQEVVMYNLAYQSIEN